MNTNEDIINKVGQLSSISFQCKKTKAEKLFHESKVLSLDAEKKMLYRFVLKEDDVINSGKVINVDLIFEKKHVFQEIFVTIIINNKMLRSIPKENSTEPISYSFVCHDFTDTLDHKSLDEPFLIFNDYKEISYSIQIFVFYNLFSSSHRSKISFENDLSEKKFTDFTITTTDDVIHVHKVVLYNVSPFFKAIIDNEMKEKLTGNIDLSNENPVIVKEFINYIYGKNYDLSIGVHDLYRLSHMYVIENLQKECEKFMLRFMDVKDIVKTLKLLELDYHTLDFLKDEVQKFIKDNQAELVQDESFVKYYVSILKPDNIHTVYPLAMENNNENFKNTVLKFINDHSIEVFKNEEFRHLLENKPKWSLSIIDSLVENKS